ncbi:MAG TPA: thiol:disulfide interchange protein DsbA/DsbL [Stenotrophobium sp.]|jgi:thiol:disulfide interchange protein DsbA|nr:thiol:disulfide interchange protein DsbA/DsbL [Stenotrophobium sp.]
MRLISGLLLSVAALLPLACSATEAAPRYKLGTDYARVRAIEPPPNPKRIQVEEFFWYGCPHCYDFDPDITAWAAHKAADVDFVRVPNSLGRPSGILDSKAFYTAKALNFGDKMHKPFFDAIHKYNQPMNTEAQIQAFFTAQTGVMPGIFTSTFNSFAVDSEVRRAEQLAQNYGIDSVPTVVVGGEYYTNGSLAHGFPDVIKVIDFLVDKVRKERAGK